MAVTKLVMPNHDWLKRWLFLGLSLLINSIGHALTVVMNLGSAVWTASAVNLYHLWPLSLRATLFTCGYYECYLDSPNHLATCNR